MRVVFDTNIFISAFAIPGGKAEEAFLQALHGTFALFTSVSILTETVNKLRTKFKWSEERVQQFLELINDAATIVKTDPHIHILADEPDNRILECALFSNADFIVTGDSHLIKLKSFQAVSIIKLSDFLNKIKTL